jgi:hypothetical protein
MVLLNRADNITLGDVQVLEVYKGTVKVWPAWNEPLPPAVTGTTLGTVTPFGATISWTNNPMASQGYAIYRDGNLVGVVPPGTTSFTQTGLTPNTAYTYRVAAISGGGAGALGNQISAQTQRFPAPSGVSGTSTTTSTATLSWGSVPDAARYNIWRNGVNIGSVTGTTFTDTGLTSGTTYGYQIQPVTAGGVTGDKSATVNVAVKVPATPVISLSSSTTSAEVHYSTIDFTANVISNPTAGTYTLQRQLPDQGWADVAAMSAGVPLGLANAIPAGQYTIGFWGAAANFRVHFVGGGFDVYSPAVSVSFRYRSKESLNVIGSEGICTDAEYFFQNAPQSWAARPSMRIQPSILDMAAAVWVTWTGYRSYYEKFGPGYLLGWQLGDLAQAADESRRSDWTGRGDGWIMSANPGERWQDWSPYAWRVCGMPAVGDAQVWGTGVNHVIGVTVHVTCIDGDNLTIGNLLIAFG